MPEKLEWPDKKTYAKLDFLNGCLKRVTAAPINTEQQPPAQGEEWIPLSRAPIRILLKVSIYSVMVYGGTISHTPPRATGPTDRERASNGEIFHDILTHCETLLILKSCRTGTGAASATVPPQTVLPHSTISLKVQSP